MDTVETTRNKAKVLARYLKGIGKPVAHGQALDALARLAGHRDWNGYAAALAQRTPDSSNASAPGEPVREAAVPEKVAGRADEASGKVLALDGPALTHQQLRRVTEDGRYGVRVALKVGLWELLENDLEWLNDEVSERITGSVADLASISYQRYDGPWPYACGRDEVVLQVDAQWEPMDGLELEDADVPDMS